MHYVFQTYLKFKIYFIFIYFLFHFWICERVGKLKKIYVKKWTGDREWERTSDIAISLATCPDHFALAPQALRYFFMEV